MRPVPAGAKVPARPQETEQPPPAAVAAAGISEPPTALTERITAVSHPPAQLALSPGG
jgi:hypothetical protein